MAGDGRKRHDISPGGPGLCTPAQLRAAAERLATILGIVEDLQGEVLDIRATMGLGGDGE